MKSPAYFWNLVHFFPLVRSPFWLFNNLTDIYIANCSLWSYWKIVFPLINVTIVQILRNVWKIEKLVVYLRL